MNNAFALSADNKAYLSRIRQKIHQHPEIAFQEHKTSALVQQELRAFGIEVQTGFAGTGVIGILKGGKAGRVIGLRADMDALPVHEQTGVDFCSQHEGMMHACGHDTHTAMLLTAAKILAAKRDEIEGTIKFIFQPAEEMLAGGKQLIADGALDNPKVDVIYGFHVWPDLPVGTIGVRHDALMASMDSFEVLLRGKSGHGAAPHQGIDAMVGGAHLITALQTIVSRETDPLDAAVVTIGSLTSGTGSNIIAETAKLAGNIRTINPETRKNVLQSFERIVAGVAQTFRLEHEIRYLADYPVTYNNNQHVDFVRNILRENFGETAVSSLKNPSMASEDFAYYLEKVAGTFLFLGVNDGAGGSFKLHHAQFLPPENALHIGVSAYLAIVANAARIPV